jgi:hypothetical protein
MRYVTVCEKTTRPVRSRAIPKELQARKDEYVIIE